MEIPDIFSSIHLPLYYFINNIEHLLLWYRPFASIRPESFLFCIAIPISFSCTIHERISGNGKIKYVQYPRFSSSEDALNMNSERRKFWRFKVVER